MTGKDLFFGLQYIGDDLIEEAELDGFGRQTVGKTVKKGLLIAAIVALFLLLTGFAVFLFKLEHLVIPRAPSETTSTNAVAQNILSMQGYEGSPTYQALSEWLAFQASYVAQNPELRFNSDYQRPDDYYHYPCYTQEMVDKVDELCEKYGLKTIGKAVFLDNQSEMEEYGFSAILAQDASPHFFNAQVFQGGSFVADGELDLSQDFEKTIQFQMRSLMKDVFYTVPLGLDDLSGLIQWNYQTRDGCTALLALSNWVGLIFLEKEDRFISVIIIDVPPSGQISEGLPKDTAFLEAVCNCFVF